MENGGHPGLMFNMNAAAKEKVREFLEQLQSLKKKG